MPVEPLEVCCTPEVAFAISEPSTSAGPRMYLARPSVEQVTIGLAGSSTMASTLLGLAQSSAVNAFSISGVIHAVSLAFLGLAAGVGLAVGVEVTGVAAGAGFVAAASAGGKPDLGAVVAAPVAVPVI